MEWTSFLAGSTALRRGPAARRGARDVGPGDDAGPCTGAGCDTAIVLCVGNAFACAVRVDHIVRGWGDNTHGQLGDGMGATVLQTHLSCAGSDCNATPVAVLAADGTMLQADRVACGEGAACAATTNVGIACWGGNGTGEGGAAAPSEVDHATLVATLPDPVGEITHMRRRPTATRATMMPNARRWVWSLPCSARTPEFDVHG